MYSYKGTDGYLSTPLRAEAFEKMAEVCRNGFDIVREGPVESRGRVVEGMINSEIVREDRWGIRFQCRSF